LLGDLLAEGQWKITSMRVLSDSKVEISFQESGKILGHEYSGVATVVTWPMPGSQGTIYGEGNAVLNTSEGDSASWRGFGIGKPTGKGMAISYRGAKAFQSTSEKLARLNRAPIIFEADADENGNGWHKHWEWK
jgi:hypothetical protein